MPNGETVQEIITDAKAARSSLAEMEHLIQGEIDELDFTVFQRGNGMTAAERKKRQELRASQTEVREAYVALAYFTLRRLDQSEQVSQLQLRMREINQGLSDDLARLEQIEGFATTAAKIADTVAKVTAKLAQVAARVSTGGL